MTTENDNSLAKISMQLELVVKVLGEIRQQLELLRQDASRKR